MTTFSEVEERLRKTALPISIGDNVDPAVVRAICDTQYQRILKIAMRECRKGAGHSSTFDHIQVSFKNWQKGSKIKSYIASHRGYMFISPQMVKKPGKPLQDYDIFKNFLSLLLHEYSHLNDYITGDIHESLYKVTRLLPMYNIVMDASTCSKGYENPTYIVGSRSELFVHLKAFGIAGKIANELLTEGKLNRAEEQFIAEVLSSLKQIGERISAEPEEAAKEATLLQTLLERDKNINLPFYSKSKIKKLESRLEHNLRSVYKSPTNRSNENIEDRSCKLGIKRFDAQILKALHIPYPVDYVSSVSKQLALNRIVSLCDTLDMKESTTEDKVVNLLHNIQSNTNGIEAGMLATCQSIDQYLKDTYKVSPDKRVIGDVASFLAPMRKKEVHDKDLSIKMQDYVRFGDNYLGMVGEEESFELITTYLSKIRVKEKEWHPTIRTTNPKYRRDTPEYVPELVAVETNITLVP